MDEEHIRDRLHELEYWKLIAADLTKIGLEMKAIGAETVAAVEANPMGFVGAADLLTTIMGRIEAIGTVVVGVQDLVDGRLTALESKPLDEDSTG